MSSGFTVEELLSKAAMDEPPELRQLYHQLNNQLGIILANAELLESKVSDDSSRARAAQVITSALDAMGTAKKIRSHQNRISETKL
jgi:nitrogen-specific signal transduction histidine kinase